MIADLDKAHELLVSRPDRLELLSLEDLVNRPPAPWQVRGVLRQQSVALLYGERGTYKSFVALDLAAAISTGQAWQGHDIVTSGLVVYVAGEGGGGMVQRARAWTEQHQTHASQVNVLFVIEPVQVMATSDDMAILIRRIRDAIGWMEPGEVDPETGHYCEEPSAREWPQLIVIDTLARCFVGDENKQEDMGQFIQGVDQLKQEFGCSILILHHTGRDTSRERGSTVLPGACDTIWRLDKDKEANDKRSGRLRLSNEKMKDGREPSSIILGFKEVAVARMAQDDPLEDLTSVVIGKPNAFLPGDDKSLHMLAYLREHGPLTYTQWLGPTGLPKTTFKRLLVGLLESGQIIEENGKYRVTEGP